jgi:NADP-dependent 3-hydroxy acid dehydrogenase YdfG
MADQKVILIAGASSGFGNLAARALARAANFAAVTAGPPRGVIGRR